MIAQTKDYVTTVFPGLLACVTVAVASVFLHEHYGGPIMLYALLLGIAFNFLSETERTVPGIELSSKTALRVGVALLGMRISFDQIAGLGWEPAALVVAAIVATILFGAVAVRFTKADRQFGILTGGAVAICGASAALAISSVLKRGPEAERNTIYTIVTVTALSTLAMIVYPIIAGWLGLDMEETGIFLGGTIHDVAQVVGAGYSVSQETGDVSTVIKLLRVALLIPVVLGIALLCRDKGEARDSKLPIPLFALVFVGFMILNNSVAVPEEIITFMKDVSQWCIVAAVAALGMKTSFKSLLASGAAPFMLIVGETVFLALFVLGGIALFT